MAITFATQEPPKDIANHYTPPELARRLVALVPYRRTDILIDPSAGASRAFYRQFRTTRRLACEIGEGTDFLADPYSYDWAISNPPYHLLWAFIDKTSCEARKGFGYLVNINGLNSLTPKRHELLAERGFGLRTLHVCNVRRWFGRYYFVVFTKVREPCVLSWDVQSW